MLLMVEKGIRGEACQTINRYVKDNNKYMKDYYKNKESLYLDYWDADNLYEQGVSEKLPIDAFLWVENTSQFSKDFIEKYNEDSDEEYFVEVDVQYPEKLHNFHNDLIFLSERMKIEKVEKSQPICMTKKGYIIHIKNFKTSIKSLISTEKKKHRAIKFNHEASLKPYIDINRKLRKN